MAVTAADLQKMLDDATAAAATETTAVDSTEALITAMAAQIASLIAGAPSLDAAAASVAQLMSTYTSNTKKLTDGLAANVQPGP